MDTASLMMVTTAQPATPAVLAAGVTTDGSANGFGTVLGQMQAEHVGITAQSQPDSVAGDTGNLPSDLSPSADSTTTLDPLVYQMMAALFAPGTTPAEVPLQAASQQPSNLDPALETSVDIVAADTSDDSAPVRPDTMSAALTELSSASSEIAQADSVALPVAAQEQPSVADVRGTFAEKLRDGMGSVSVASNEKKVASPPQEGKATIPAVPPATAEAQTPQMSVAVKEISVQRPLRDLNAELQQNLQALADVEQAPAESDVDSDVSLRQIRQDAATKPVLTYGGGHMSGRMLSQQTTGESEPVVQHGLSISLSEGENEGSSSLLRQAVTTVAQAEPETAGDHQGAQIDYPETPHHAGGVAGAAKAAVALAEKSEHAPAPVAQQVADTVLDRLHTAESKPGTEQRVTLKLTPEHLGEIQLSFQMDSKQGVRVEVVAEHRATRDLLQQQSDDLKENLARQNIRLDSFEVSTGSSGAGSQQSQDWRRLAAEHQLQQAIQVKPVARMFGDTGVSTISYIAPQYQSTLDVRF